MNISKLLRSLFRSLMFHAVEDIGAGGGEGDALDEISDLIPDEPGEGEEGANAGQQGGQQQAQPEQTQADNPDEPTFTIKVDGEDRVIKQSELLANAQKYEAGNKRLEEAANLRKQIEPEKQAVVQERQQLSQALQHYTTQLATVLQATQPNWEQLAQQDPGEYVRQRHAWEQKLGDLQRAQEAQAVLTQREQTEQAQQLRTRAVEEHSKLLEAIPEWKDAAKEKSGAEAVGGYLQKSGFTTDELSRLYDHRLVVLSHKAMLYDQLQQQQVQASQRVAKVPPRAERPGTSMQSAQGEPNRRAALDRFSKDPSIDNLASLL